MDAACSEEELEGIGPEATYATDEIFIPGDDDFHVDLPQSERNAVLSNVELRNAADLHASDAPNLRGRTPEEVSREAGRIRLGESFTSFPGFDRCLDSWCVQNLRASFKYATKASHVVRVCRFGELTRHKYIQPAIAPKPASTIANNNIHFLVHGQSTSTPEAQSDSDFLSQLSPHDSPHDSNTDKENVQGHRLLPIPIDRNPLAPKNMNVADGIILSNTQSKEPGDQQPRPYSRVQHTSEWLAPANSSKEGRTIPKQGVCGQLARFLPEDGQTTQSKIPCPFRVRATLSKRDGRIRITVCELKHTCPSFPHRWRGPAHKAKWLAATLSNRVVQSLKAPVADLLGAFRMDYKKSTNYFQAWRARDQVKDWYLGGQRVSFHKIPSLLERISEINPDSVVDWGTEQYSNIFKRAFICPSATRDMLQYCQPLVALDAAHTKNRKYPIQIFLATILDGNSNVVILCYAVAPTETKESWVWFLDLMARSLKGINNDWIPMISDRAKGLLPAVAQVFPGKVHAYCAVHLRGNVKVKYGKTAAQYFTGCVYSNTKVRFDRLLQKLSQALSAGSDAANYIRDIDPKLWARFAFPRPKLGKVSSNPAESANSGLLPLRQYAPFKFLVQMWFYMQAKHKDRKEAYMKSKEEFSHVARRRLDKNKATYGQWQVLDDGEGSAKVQTQDMKEEYLVGMYPTPTCSCWELQEMCWPCQHVMAWDDLQGQDYTRHFHKCWRIDSLGAMYQGRMPPFLSSDLELTTICLPPETAVKKGRHRLVRIPSGGGSLRNQRVGEDEYIDENGNLYRRYETEDNPTLVDPMPRSSNTPDASVTQRGRKRKPNNTVKCGKCGKEGHNRRTCSHKSPSNETEQDVEGTMSIVEDEGETVPLSLQATTEVLDLELRANANASEFVPDEVGGEDYSDVEEEDPGDDSMQLREIYGGEFGTSQKAQYPDWQAYNLLNWEGVSQIGAHLEKGWEPPMHEQVEIT